jgi:Tfp pilus assembly protein PilV
MMKDHKRDSGSTLAEVVIAMLIMGISGVAISGALLVSRPVTDHLISREQSTLVFQSDVANVRATAYRFCSPTNLNSVDNIYPVASSDKSTSVETSILINDTWVPCTKNLFQTNSYKKADGTVLDLTSWMSYIQTATVQKVTLTKSRAKGDSLVQVIAKVNKE